ncbi:hypothetical protein DVH05_010177 [Phytophthora capsici]|nr:hypothetical protein DVH05_010177 [Phytophthora capsici]
MWKTVNSKYVKAYAKFYVSGQNSNEFYNFCEGKLDVVHLKACLQVKPELEEYVRGGMREEDEIDSLGLCGGKTKRLTSTSSKWQDGLLKTVNRLADIVIGGGQNAAKMPPSEKPIPTSQDEDLLIERIGKLHQLIGQVQERQRKTELDGHVDATLAASLTLYQQRLQQNEDRLAALE